MKIEGYVFAFIAAFLVPVTIVYWVLSQDPTGTTCLALSIGLTFMGLADQIVMMAFGLILGSAAVATAIAFGLGGRDAAARMLEQWADEHEPPARLPPPRLRKASPPEPDDTQPPLA